MGMYFPHLFKPMRIGSLELKNRVVMSPMATGFFENGHVTPRVKSFYSARAKGGVGLIIVGGVYITWPDSADISSIGKHAHLKDDSVIKGWQGLIKELHDHGAKVGVQIFHPGRQTISSQWGEQPVGPSSLPCPGIKDLPRKLTVEEIGELVKLFSDAGKRAEEAGFDLIEIHGAHGYLISSFLSPHSNRRKDIFGGLLKNRARFALQIIKEVKDKVNSDMPLGIRINGQDNIEGGVTLDEAKSLASLLETSGIAFLDVSAGVYGGYPSLAPMAEPQGIFISLAEAIKGAVTVPVIGVGRIKDPHYADNIVRQGKVDLVALGRALIADPDWPKKSAKGESNRIRMCISCNQGCIDRIEQINFQSRKVSTTCMINHWVGREREMIQGKAVCRKRILVIGGGPAGLTFSTIAAGRGHIVKLVERDSELGGQFRLAALPPTKEGIGYAIKYMVRKSKDAGVTLTTKFPYSKHLLKEFDPQIVIVATGAQPLVPSIPGVENENVVTAHDVLIGRKAIGTWVLIVGGGSVGLETADYLRSKGRNVHVVEMKKRFGTDMGTVALLTLRRRLESKGVNLTESFKVTAISDREVQGIRDGLEDTITGLDTIILAVGSLPENHIIKEIRDSVDETYVIGDAAQPRNALTAIHEGLELAARI